MPAIILIATIVWWVLVQIWIVNAKFWSTHPIPPPKHITHTHTHTHLHQSLLHNNIMFMNNRCLYIPYSLKFSRLKIFADFAGLRVAVKILPRNFKSQLMQGEAGSYTTKFNPQKIVFEQDLAKPRNILSSKILGYTVHIIMYVHQWSVTSWVSVMVEH